MKQILCIVFLSLFFMLSASDADISHPEIPLSQSESQSVYEKVKPAVFQIKTAKDEKASKASYGSGFVVDKDGLIITNYHVVATVLQDEDKRYNIYLVDGKHSLPATIVSFSVIYDIALLKVDKTFDTVLRIEKDTPKHGENIYSIGKPKELNMTIVDGKYNGIIKKAIYERIQMSTPLNAGMSGGPTVNASGDVIGINVSVLLSSDNISFAVPIDKALGMIEKYKQSKTVVQEKDVDAIVKKQLTTIESSLMKEVTENKQPPETLEKWHYAPPSKSLKCWTTSYKNDEKNYEKTTHSCDLKNSAYLERGLYSGTYSIDYFVIDNLKLTTPQFYHQVKTRFENTSPIYSTKDDFTAHKCNNSVIVNKHNISFQVKYCVNEFLKYSELYRATVVAASFGNADTAIIVNMDLNGFTKEHIKKFVTLYLSSIGENNE